MNQDNHTALEPCAGCGALPIETSRAGDIVYVCSNIDSDGNKVSFMCDDGTGEPPAWEKKNAVKQWNERQRKLSASADQFLMDVVERTLRDL